MLNQISVSERIIDICNDIIKNDPELGRELFKQDWKCNTWTEDNSGIKVPGNGTVRLLGILNNIVGYKPDGQPYIRAIYDSTGKKIIKLEPNV